MQQLFDLFIGCYGNKDEPSLHWVQYHVNENRFTKVSSFRGIDNPSYLSVDSGRGRVYAISEAEAGEVVCCQIDRSTNHIAELNRVPANGAPCFTDFIRDENVLCTANYGGGSIIIHSLLQDGAIGDVLMSETFAANKRGDVSRIHTFRRVRNSKYYVAADIGLSMLYVYQLQKDRTFLLIKRHALPKGCGPREVAFHPRKNRMYIVNEYHQTVLTYGFGDNFDEMVLMQVLPTVPADFKGENYGAAIEITSCGKFVYLSNRGHDTLFSLRVNGDGTLHRIGWTKIAGKWPRHFKLLPNTNIVLVANERTNEVVVMKRQATGNLQMTAGVLQIEKPVCIQALV